MIKYHIILSIFFFFSIIALSVDDVFAQNYEQSPPKNEYNPPPSGQSEEQPQNNDQRQDSLEIYNNLDTIESVPKYKFL